MRVNFIRGSEPWVPSHAVNFWTLSASDRSGMWNPVRYSPSSFSKRIFNRFSLAVGGRPGRRSFLRRSCSLLSRLIKLKGFVSESKVGTIR